MSERERYVEWMLGRMVDRFLAWPLPKDFGPDCGISFDGRKDDEWNKNKTWPVGTNLFTAEQARAMFRHAMGADDIDGFLSHAQEHGLELEPVGWRCEHGCGIKRPHTHTAEEVAALRQQNGGCTSEGK